MSMSKRFARQVLVHERSAIDKAVHRTIAQYPLINLSLLLYSRYRGNVFESTISTQNQYLEVSNNNVNNVLTFFIV